jgi:quercetin dioxygenase-like cupin family protein
VVYKIRQLFLASQTKLKSLWVLGDFYTIKISGDETHGRYSVWEIDVAPNNGPPLHKHSMEDEAFYVLEEETKGTKGQLIYVPRGEFQIPSHQRL